MVPLLDQVEDGAFVAMDVRPHNAEGELQIDSVIVAASIHGELVFSPLMVQYFSSSNLTRQCGCSPQINGLQVDSCGVCGGNTSTVDCNGDCFGSAYFDSRGLCSRGRTAITPSSTFGDPASINFSRDFSADVFNWIILLLTLSCMSFCSSLCLYVVRIVVLRAELHPDRPMYDRVRVTHIAAHLGLWNESLSQSQRDQIGEFLYQQLDEEEFRGADCAICLCPLEHGVVCRKMPPPCEHVFHKDCIDSWLQRSHVCPVCRRAIDLLLEPPVNPTTVAAENNTTASDEETNAENNISTRNGDYFLIRIRDFE